MSGNHAFCSKSNDTVRIFDISAPSNPQRGKLILGGLVIAINKHIAYLASQGEFQVMDISDPKLPNKLGTLSLDSSIYENIAAEGGFAYLCAQENGLEVIDCRNPEAPKLVGNYPAQRAVHVAVAGKIAVVSVGGDGGLQVLDVSDPARPFQLSAIKPEGADKVAVTGLALSDNRVWVTWHVTTQDGEGWRTEIFDVSEPISPRRLGRVDENFGKLRVYGRTAYAVGIHGLQILELKTLPLRLEPAPRRAGVLQLTGPPGLNVRVQRSADLRAWTDWGTVRLGAEPRELSERPQGAGFFRIER